MLQFHYHDFEFSFAYVSRRYFERNRPRDWGKSDSKEHFKRSFTNRGIPDEYSRILLLRTCNCQKDGERGRGEGGGGWSNAQREEQSSTRAAKGPQNLCWHSCQDVRENFVTFLVSSTTYAARISRIKGTKLERNKRLKKRCKRKRSSVAFLPRSSVKIRAASGKTPLARLECVTSEEIKPARYY